MKVYEFLIDGFETVEALGTADILIRGGQDVTLVSLTGKTNVTSAQNFEVKADALFEDLDFEDAQVLVLPGGPGTKNLRMHEGLKKLCCEKALNPNIFICAICAAPTALGMWGLLQGKRATCFPGEEEKLYGAVVTKEGVVTDGHIITAKGMGKSLEFGIEILKALIGEEKAEAVREKAQM